MLQKGSAREIEAKTLCTLALCISGLRLNAGNCMDAQKWYCKIFIGIVNDVMQLVNKRYCPNMIILL